MSDGWIGVDLDGTLAHYDGWRGMGHVGAPIPKMVARVRKWLAEGKDVRIFTARACTEQPLDALVEAVTAIGNWSLEQFGECLPIVSEKTPDMIELWDDRCVQVIPNTGERADRQSDAVTPVL